MRPYVVTRGHTADPPLLCLHGIGSCADAFDPQAPIAEAVGRRIIAWDAPGYRNTPDPERRFGLDDWADAAAALVVDHGGRADVLGVSWGGVTATRLALRHPQLVRTLILADSSVGSGRTPESASAMRERARDVERFGLEDFARSRAPRLLTSAAPPELVDEVAQLMIDSVRPTPYAWACDSMAETDHTDALPSIGAPTLVIVGADDVVTPPRFSQQLAAGIPGAQLVTIDRAGHLANQERPAVFNEAVVGFLGDRG